MSQSKRQRNRISLLMIGALMVVLSGLLSWLSRGFTFDTDAYQRPLVSFIGLMSVMFVVHLIGFRVALRSESNRRMIAGIWAVAVLARLIVIPSHPIQEVDLYRYLWDGQVTCAGESPFKYAPARVIAAVERPSSGDPALNRLAQLANTSRSINTILRRVHFPQLPTVYPPVSQAVFAIVAAVVPDQASVYTHVTAMKVAIVCFDLGVLGVLVWMLQMTGLHVAWAITYAWNPLVLKEFAGSGHLDSIAVFFAVLSVALTIKTLQRPTATGWMAASAALALGFGAKLYPIVVLPILLAACVRTDGFKRAITCGGTFALIGILCVAPVLLTDRPVVQTPVVEISAEPAIVDELEPPDFFEGLQLAPPEQFTGETLVEPVVAPTDGIATFLWRWEMNDLVFLLIVENLKPSQNSPWFCIAPESFRASTSNWVANRMGVGPAYGPFLLARAITVMMFLAACLWLMWRLPAADPIAYGRTAFLVIALFWMLAPTLNPWYWAWALPLVCFTQSRGWLLVSGMLAVYYFRFWLIYHSGDAIMQYAPYPGAETFDFVIVFAEHLPWMFLVGWQYITNRNRPNSLVQKPSASA